MKTHAQHLLKLSWKCAVNSGETLVKCNASNKNERVQLVFAKLVCKLLDVSFQFECWVVEDSVKGLSLGCAWWWRSKVLHACCDADEYSGTLVRIVAWNECKLWRIVILLFVKLFPTFSTNSLLNKYFHYTFVLQNFQLEKDISAIEKLLKSLNCSSRDSMLLLCNNIHDCTPRTQQTNHSQPRLTTTLAHSPTQLNQNYNVVRNMKLPTIRLNISFSMKRKKRIQNCNRKVQWSQLRAGESSVDWSWHPQHFWLLSHCETGSRVYLCMTRQNSVINHSECASLRGLLIQLHFRAD